MHVQAHMSGQISGQVPNQSGPQLSGLPQQNGGSLTSPLPSLGGMRNTRNMDPDLATARRCMGERIFELFQRQQASHQWQPRLNELVKRLEESLFRNATSKEEYMNMETLEHRLQTLIKNIPPNNQSQQLPTMIPTPGMSHNSSSNSTVPSSGDNFSSCSTVAPNTISTGNLLPAVNGSTIDVHGSSFNASDGSLPTGYHQSPANISTGSGGNNMMSSMGVPRIASQMIPTPGLTNPQSMSMNSEYSNGVGYLALNPHWYHISNSQSSILEVQTTVYCMAWAAKWAPE